MTSSQHAHRLCVDSGLRLSPRLAGPVLGLRLAGPRWKKKREVRDRAGEIYVILASQWEQLGNGEYTAAVKPVLLELCAELRPALERNTVRSQGLSVPTQVLTTLGFLATGAFQRELADRSGVCQSTLSRAMPAVWDGIIRMSSRGPWLPPKNVATDPNTGAGAQTATEGCWRCGRPGHIRRDCPMMDVGQVVRVAGPPTPPYGPGEAYRIPVRIQRGTYQALLDSGCMQTMHYPAAPGAVRGVGRGVKRFGAVKDGVRGVRSESESDSRRQRAWRPFFETDNPFKFAI
ncbi:hypothetical protein N1851_020132 [Merluccius polli]|uniref:CCHC-type domain-containing protein n=1 Tax=Merluccius polli TaxID=89951 RepID=A0AA47MLC9_MERPO|nr:hypothetical protein N1851_020132 [Merluccius polli]